jgi:predicted small metal-binding protein
MTGAFTISGQRYTLDSTRIEAVLADELPEPIRDHFVIVGGRRFPPKQVLRAVTGLDRADFTTHQARRVLTRLGFLAGRASEPAQLATAELGYGPHGGRQAEALRPYVGRWVALGEPCEVLVAADSPQEVLAWLARHGRRTSGMFRVPEDRAGAEGVAPI